MSTLSDLKHILENAKKQDRNLDFFTTKYDNIFAIPFCSKGIKEYSGVGFLAIANRTKIKEKFSALVDIGIIEEKVENGYSFLTVDIENIPAKYFEDFYNLIHNANYETSYERREEDFLQGKWVFDYGLFLSVQLKETENAIKKGFVELFSYLTEPILQNLNRYSFIQDNANVIDWNKIATDILNKKFPKG
jgi:hypothetical protein